LEVFHGVAVQIIPEEVPEVEREFLVGVVVHIHSILYAESKTAAPFSSSYGAAVFVPVPAITRILFSF
jgi:hypothetical protein